MHISPTDPTHIHAHIIHIPHAHTYTYHTHTPHKYNIHTYMHISHTHPTYIHAIFKTVCPLFRDTHGHLCS
ncbi:hypothetical protein LEMLEM_LOCUS5932 [Lemmus lemmus]